MTTPLEKALKPLLAKTPGYSVAVAIPNQGLWFSQSGLADIQTNKKLTASSLFQVASITKAFTAVLIMQLSEERKLNLSDKVSQYFPMQEFPIQEMTIEQLLMHTSGLANYHQHPTEDEVNKSPEQLIQNSLQQGNLFCPGTAWRYSNTGYALLGKVIEKVDNKPLQVVIKDRITTPLSLNNTLLRTALDNVNLATGHISREVTKPNDQYTAAYAAGGIASTAEDILIFWHALLSGKIVSQNSLQEMFKLLAPIDQNQAIFYGKGVQFFDIQPGPGVMIGHSGAIDGFKSVVAYLPEDDVYISVLFNNQNVSAEAGLWHVLKALRAIKNYAH